MDGLKIDEKLKGVHPALFWFVFAVSTLGVLMAISFLVFNVYNQNVRYKTSMFTERMLCGALELTLHTLIILFYCC